VLLKRISGGVEALDLGVVANFLVALCTSKVLRSEVTIRSSISYR